MLQSRTPERTDPRRRGPKPLVKSKPGQIGIALAGGGPLGGIYEIGALAALADCLRGLDFNKLDVYVGVSSGSFVAAALANGITPAQMSAMFIESDTAVEPFDPALLLKPAYYEYFRRAMSLPPLIISTMWRYLHAPFSVGLFDSLQRLGRAIPAGIFDGAHIDASLANVFSAPGRSNDFRKLKRKLYIVATDLDTGQTVEFGAKGFDAVPISTAVQASAALPGLFPPVEIAGRHYADGALKKTLHASVALNHGAQLVLCINPLVPFDAARPTADMPVPQHLADGGLPAILSQTLRTILHSRLEVGLEGYRTTYKDADLVLFEPNRYDAEMFFTNILSYSSRRRLAEHAYQKTRDELRARHAELAPILAHHGIVIDMGAVDDSRSHLVDGVRPSNSGYGEWISRTLNESLADLQRWIRTSESLNAAAIKPRRITAAQRKARVKRAR